MVSFEEEWKFSLFFLIIILSIISFEFFYKNYKKFFIRAYFLKRNKVLQDKFSRVFRFDDFKVLQDEFSQAIKRGPKRYFTSMFLHLYLMTLFVLILFDNFFSFKNSIQIVEIIDTNFKVKNLLSWKKIVLIKKLSLNYSYCSVIVVVYNNKKCFWVCWELNKREWKNT